MENFTKRLNELIEESKITQRDLAQDIGVTESAISKYISGERIPNSEIISNLATALGTTSDYLLGLSNNKSSLTYPELAGILSRNSKELTPEQKNKLIQIIVKY